MTTHHRQAPRDLFQKLLVASPNTRLGHQQVVREPFFRPVAFGLLDGDWSQALAAALWPYVGASIIWTTMTQTSHVQEACHEDLPDDACWTARQIAHSYDYSVHDELENAVVSALTAGLNAQSLHHALPSIAQSRLPALYDEYYAIAAKHGATVAAALARVHPHASHLDVLHVDGGACVPGLGAKAEAICAAAAEAVGGADESAAGDSASEARARGAVHRAVLALGVHGRHEVDAPLAQPIEEIDLALGRREAKQGGDAAGVRAAHAPADDLDGVRVRRGPVRVGALGHARC